VPYASVASLVHPLTTAHLRARKNAPLELTPVSRNLLLSFPFGFPFVIRVGKASSLLCHSKPQPPHRLKHRTQPATVEPETCPG